MIGILGGTFDPIHFGHLRPALEIAEIFSLDELRFIPSARPPHRWQPVASAEHRLEMVKLAIAETPGFVLDEREYHRQGSSYTVDTLQSIRDDVGDTPIVMLLGQDAFESFTDWHDWKKILTLAHIVVSSRPGYRHARQDWMQARLIESSREMQKQMRQTAAGNICFCEVTQLDISATIIREQILAGKSSRYLLPLSVEHYIHEHQLYMD
jgi:nicotinate-nucleotide adenylyltransferase